MPGRGSGHRVVASRSEPDLSARPSARGGAAIVVLALLCSAGPASAQDAPPDTLAAAADTLGAPPDTLAGPVVVDAVPIPLDTLAFGLAPGDTVPVLARRFREGEGARELAGVPSEDIRPRNPRNAAIRSFLLPGWGQIHTGHPWRAALFAGAEVGFAYMGYRKQQEALDKKEEVRGARAAFLADPPEGAPEDSLALEEVFRQTVEFRQLDAELEAIEERREDFYAWAIASVIFSAVDAYAAAQLDPVRVGVTPGERRVWASLRLPVGAAPPRRSPRAGPP